MELVARVRGLDPGLGDKVPEETHRRLDADEVHVVPGPVGHLVALAVARRPLRAQLLRLAALGALAVPLALFALFRDEGQVSHLVRPTPTYRLREPRW